MRDPLLTYLGDHAAGAAGAIDVLSSLVRRHRGTRTGAVLRNLLDEIRADDRTLRAFASTVGANGPRPKRLFGKAAGKLTRARLGSLAGTNQPFALFEALEMLAIGILGKRSLWRALGEVADARPEVRRLDLPELEARAEEQFARVEALRLETAPSAIGR